MRVLRIPRWTSEYPRTMPDELTTEDCALINRKVDEYFAKAGHPVKARKPNFFKGGNRALRPDRRRG